MNKAALIFILAGTVLLLITLKKLKLRYTLLSAISGLAAFFAADWVCSFYSPGLPVNVFTLTLSAIGGIPGVILLSFLQTFLI